MMGMADACPDVTFGELSCQIGNDNSQNVDVLKEDSGRQQTFYVVKYSC